MALAATPVSAAAEQQHDYADNQEQFHGKPSVDGAATPVGPQARSSFVKQRAQNQIFDAPH
jgi:hypothetical protein